MDVFPADFLDAIPQDKRPVALAWWSSLSDDQRRQLADLWDDRLEVRFFAPQADDSGAADSWEQVPRVLGGRFVPSDDAWGLDEWGPGYFEHLLQHPELTLIWEPEFRTFHIGCSRHAAARSCLESQHIHSTFTCPFDSDSCPMLPLRGSRLHPPASRDPQT